MHVQLWFKFMGFIAMRYITFLFLLCSLSAFAQPSITPSTKWSVFDGNNSWVADVSGLFGQSNISMSASVANTNTSATRFTLNSNSTGTPDAGFGSVLLFQGESSTTNAQDMVGLRASWTTATHASREAQFAVQLGDNGGALTEVLTVNRSSDADGALLIGTGNSLQIDNDEMTPGLPFSINGGTNTVTVGGGSGGVVIGGTAGSGTIQIFSSTGNISEIRETSATTTTIGSGIFARSTGTPAAGFGPRLDFYAESNTTLDRDAGRIETPWTTATDASRTSDMVISTVNSGTTGEAFRIYGDKRAMVGGGTNQASAAFQITSTTGGLLMPKMTNTEMLAIASPAEGLEVYNTTVGGKCIYNGTDWERLSCTKAPTVTVGAGAGTGATTSVSGTDMAGVITVTTGTTLIVGNIVTLDFHTDFDTAPRAVILSGANEDGVSALYVQSGLRCYYAPSADITTVDFEIDSGSGFNGMNESTVYKFYYHVIQ